MSRTSYIDWRKRLAAADQIGRLFGDHNYRCVDIAADQVGHDRGINDAQPVDPEDSQLAVNYRGGVVRGAYFAGTERVMDTDAGCPDMRIDRLIRGLVRPGCDFTGDEWAQRSLVCDLANDPQSRPEGRPILIGGKEILTNAHWLAWII
jgi:hypothetical protein